MTKEERSHSGSNGDDDRPRLSDVREVVMSKKDVATIAAEEAYQLLVEDTSVGTKAERIEELASRLRELQPYVTPEIDSKDVTFREFTRVETDTVCVIATVRYATGVTVHREAIQDYGDGLLALARSQALAELQANPHAVPSGCEVEMREIEIPETWKRA
jgi:hypothetical protein